MSQRPGLTPQQHRVLDRLEAVFPDPRSAADLAPELGMDVPAALSALRALQRRRLVRRWPMFMGETAEAELYVAATKPF